MKRNSTLRTGLLLTLLMLLGLTGFLQAAVISGAITNNEATPIDSSFIQLYRLEGNHVSYTAFRTTYANLGGIYNFANIPTGDYYVFANAPEFERGFYKDPADGSLKVVEVDADDQEVIGINIQLAPHNDPPPPPLHATILGAVFGNGHVPLANKTIGIVTTDNLNVPILNLITHTNFNGCYFFHDIGAGTYKTCVLDANNLPVAYSQEFTVTSNVMIDSVDILLNEDPPPPPPALGNVSGYIIGGDINPIAGQIGIVSITDLLTPIPGLISHSNCQRFYVIHSIPAGTYKTCLLDQTMQPIAYSDEVTIVGNDFHENVNIVVGNIESYSISGTVTSVLAQPFLNGIVEIRTVPDSTNTNMIHIHRTVHLDLSGAYTFDNVPVGQYIISVWTHMFPRVFYPGIFDIQQATPVNVVDQSLTGLDIIIPLAQRYIISGYVLDEITDAPLAGILVKTDRMGFHHFPMQDSLFTNEFFAVTDAAGFYSIEAPMGRYTVAALDSTHTYRHQFFDHSPNPFHAQVILLNHDFTNVNFDLIPVQDSLHYSISGLVSDNGEPITYPVRVVAVSSDEDWEDSAITHPDGTYTIHNVRPGSYYVVAYSLYTAPRFYENALNWEDAETVIVDGTISNINFDLTDDVADGPSTLSGNIYGLNGNGMENVLVMLTDSENQVIGFARTNELGQYSITNVPAQGYTVIATKIGIPTATQNLYLFGDGNLNMTLNVATENEDNYIPVTTSKITNYPNPFNPNTNIHFSVPKDSRVNVQIYNIKGQNIKNLLNNTLKAGNHSLTWDGTDNNGNHVTSGIYLIKMQGDGFKSNHKMSLLK